MADSDGRVLGAALVAWAADGRGRALCCDFDGTLAPIVDDPAAAVAADGAVEVLARLADRLDVVAVVSGRPAAYLAERVRAPGVVLAGLYGLERVVDGRVERPEGLAPWLAVVAAAADDAAATAPAGLEVERKSATVTLHWRRAPDAAAWAERFAADTTARTGLVAHAGKMSVELRPPIGGDKGDVVDGVAATVEGVAFVGDDVGDIPAFEALARLAGAGRPVLRVAVGGDEAPAALLAAADVVVDDPADVVAALEVLAAALGA